MKYRRQCTSSYILKVSCKCMVYVKIYQRFLFFVFSKEIADCCSIRLATLPLISVRICLKKFENFLPRSFGIVVQRSGCGAEGREFESSLRHNFKVSRLDKRLKWPIFSRADKSVSFNILTKNCFIISIVQCYIIIIHDFKSIDFFVNHTNLHHQILLFIHFHQKIHSLLQF